MPTYRLDQIREDRVQWILTKNGEFTCRSAWEAMRNHYPIVHWAKLLWHKDFIPRCSVICWLACKNRMNTKDKLCSWGIVTDSTCALCGNGVESRDHLFFGCVFSRYVWEAVLFRCDVQYMCSNWEEEVEKAVKRFSGSNFGVRLGRVSFTVAVYCLWKERNQRIFRGIAKTPSSVVSDIEKFICAKTWHWQVTRNYSNWLVCKNWGMNEKILM